MYKKWIKPGEQNIPFQRKLLQRLTLREQLQ